MEQARPGARAIVSASAGTPALSSSLTQPAWPFCAAMCSGVCPICAVMIATTGGKRSGAVPDNDHRADESCGGSVVWRAVSSRLASAPAFSSAAIVSAEPFCAAINSGVQDPCGCG